MKFVPAKQIHSRGALSVAYNVQSNEEKVVSCGVDGTICVWDRDALSEDGSPMTREISDRTHSCCALYDNKVYAGFTQTDLSTGVEKQVVGSFGTENEEDAVKTIMSFSLDVTAIRVSKDWIIAGSSDFSVKRADRDDEDMSAGYNRYELNAQILDIQINPTEKAFAVSSCDGFVNIFAGESTEPVSSLKLFAPIRDLDDSFPRVHMAWSIDGKSLFVPCKGMVKILAKKGDKWIAEKDFRHDDEKEDDFSVVALSHCGKYLAASTMSSLVHIWEIESGILVSTTDYSNERAGRITGLTYLGAKSKRLIIADSHGNIVTLEEAGPSKEKKEEKKSNVFVDDEAMQEDSFDANDKEEEEEDDDIVVNKNKKFIVEDDEMDEDTRMSSSIAAIKKKYGYDDDGMRMDEPDGNSFDEDPFSNIDARPGSTMKKMEKSEKAAPVRVVEKYIPLTPPSYFSSASSPRNITQRYIKWNGFGTIRVLESEDGESSLEIRFHDSSIHAEMILSNSDLNYSMGDLNDKVVALATRLKGASKHLYVKLLNSWDSNDDHWEIQLTKGELPDDVVVSSEFVALLCENRNIRVFTHAGTQRHVITHPTPILTLSAFSDRLAVVSIAGGPMFFSHKDQTNYEFPLTLNEYRLGALSQWWSTTSMADPSTPSIRDQPLALSKGSELTWIGYTNRGRIVAQASDSVIRLLVSPPHSPSFWTPIFDGTEALTSPSDFIWPVSVVEKPVTQLRYVYCRGVKYPMATLKLNPIIANWSLPLCNKASDKSALEEELFLNELAMSAANENELKDLSSNHLKTIIKLFSLALKGDRESRAVEMANLTTSSKGVQLLANWAAKQRRHALVEKVSEVGRRKAEEEDEAVSRQLGYGRWADKERENDDGGNRVLPKKVPLRRSIAVASSSKYHKIDEIVDESVESATSSVEEPQSEIGSQGVFNLDTSVTVPQRNPFKRSLDDSVADISSTSVFDDLDSPAPTRKKLKETQNTVPAPIAQKQAKLSFGSNKKASGYDLWLVENEERLKGDFVGGEEDFIKYCTQAYRMLSGAERKEWRTKAESSS